MGMLSYLMLDSRLNDLQDRIAVVHARSQVRVSGDIDALRGDLVGLRQDVDELALFARALATLLIDKGILTQQELADRVAESDAEDGVEDGRLGNVETIVPEDSPPPEQR